MSIYNLVPAWKVRSMAARQRAFRLRAPPPSAWVTPIGELPFLTRRVLRVIAANPSINLTELDKLARLDAHVRPTADSLVLLGLCSRVGFRYTLTLDGQQTLLQSPAQDDRDTGLRATAYLFS